MARQAEEILLALYRLFSYNYFVSPFLNDRYRHEFQVFSELEGFLQGLVGCSFLITLIFHGGLSLILELSAKTTT